MALAPGAWTSQPGRETPHERDLDFFFTGMVHFAKRASWPPGAWGTARHLWFTLGHLLWYGVSWSLLWLSLRDFKKRITERHLRTAANVLQASHYLPTLIALVPHPPSVHVRGAVAFALQFGITPLGLLASIDATHEQEQRALAALGDAQRARRHAEEIAASRRAFLRYAFHGACQCAAGVRGGIRGRVPFATTCFHELHHSPVSAPSTAISLQSYGYPSSRWRWASKTSRLHSASKRCRRHLE